MNAAHPVLLALGADTPLPPALDAALGAAGLAYTPHRLTHQAGAGADAPPQPPPQLGRALILYGDPAQGVDAFAPAAGALADACIAQNKPVLALGTGMLWLCAHLGGTFSPPGTQPDCPQTDAAGRITTYVRTGTFLYPLCGDLLPIRTPLGGEPCLHLLPHGFMLCAVCEDGTIAAMQHAGGRPIYGMRPLPFAPQDTAVLAGLIHLLQ